MVAAGVWIGLGIFISNYVASHTPDLTMAESTIAQNICCSLLWKNYVMLSLTRGSDMWLPLIIDTWVNMVSFIFKQKFKRHPLLRLPGQDGRVASRGSASAAQISTRRYMELHSYFAMAVVICCCFKTLTSLGYLYHENLAWMGYNIPIPLRCEAATCQPCPSLTSMLTLITQNPFFFQKNFHSTNSQREVILLTKTKGTMDKTHFWLDRGQQCY